MKLLLLIPSAALLALGAEGLYHAAKGRERVAVECSSLAHGRPASHRLAVAGCEVDYAGVGYRGDDRIEELFFPARPAGWGTPAPLVIFTRNAAALSLAQPVLAGGHRLPQDASFAALQKSLEAAGVTSSIEGLARAGFIEGLRTRRILSGLTATPVAADAILIDLEGTPDFLRPILALAAGLLLGALPFVPWPRTLEGDADARHANEPPVLPTLPSEVLSRLTGASDVPPVVLPRLLLLNVGVRSGPDAVESAPPLGRREEVIQMLCGIVPDLVVRSDRRTLTRADGSIAIDLGLQDPVATAVIDARGEAGAALVKEILLMTPWRAFVPKTGLFITGAELAVMAALTRAHE